MKSDNREKKRPESLTSEELVELAILQEELNQLKKEQGIEDEKKGLWKVLSAYFEKKEVKPKQISVVNRKKYLYFLIFTGWCGGHMFYAKKYSTAWLYLLFFWTGFPTAMAIVDWLIWLPKKSDENGNIEI